MPETLAYQMRPVHLDDILGQEHLVGENGIIKKMALKKKPMSMILYGTPGCGKTTIATCLANDLEIPYRFFNASTGNKKEMDIIIEEAKLYGGMFVIVDEVHRLNKDKQDHLLPHLESGLLTIVGCTTANPYHSINPAIRSRCHIFEVEALKEEDIIKGLKRAATKLELNYEESVLIKLAKLSSGDIRYGLNCLELLSTLSVNQHIDEATFEQCHFKANMQYDSGEDAYYDTLSGFQKSIRGSDVNGALYYLAKLISFNDLESLERRLLTIAYEDIGLANPMVCARTLQAIDAAKRIGFPEARIPLSVAVIDLALSPKSRSAERAIDNAIACLNEHPLPTPRYLRLTPVGLSEDEKYSYDGKHYWEYLQYLPLGLEKEQFYIPALTSPYEKNLTENYERIMKHGRTSDIVKLNHLKDNKSAKD